LGWARWFGGHRGLRGDGMEEGVGRAFHFIHSGPTQQQMKISPVTSARAKPNGGLGGSLGRRKINGAGALQLFCTSPADYSHQAGSPRRCRSCSSLDQPCRNLVTLQEGAQTPLPSPCPFLPDPNQPPPPPFLAARKVWRGEMKVIYGPVTFRASAPGRQDE